MIITFSGLPGAGKTSVSRIVAKKLDYSFFSAGEYARRIAKEKNLSLIDFLGHKELVKNVDKKVKSFKSKKNIVVDSRLSAYLLPKAKFRIFLKAPLRVRARRIHSRQSIGLITALRMTRKRQVEEVKVYKRVYGIDYRNPKLYNIVLNTKGHSAKQTADALLKIIRGEK